MASLTISNMPPEIMLLIFSYLDGRSLVNASHVNPDWLATCKSNTTLRRRLKQQAMKRKRLRWCRAKYGDGTITKIRRKPDRSKLMYQLLLLRNMWLQIYHTLLLWSEWENALL